MSKKYLIGGIIVIAVIGVFWSIQHWKKTANGDDARLFGEIKDQPALVDLFNKAVTKENDLAAHPDQAGLYFDLGLYWKDIGEQGGPKDFLQKSLAVYESGIPRFGQSNILFYLNAGQLAEETGDYVKARGYYQKAIQISPADESGYIDLANLYNYRLHQPEAAVVAVYNAGQKAMFNATPIVVARAAYFKRIGDYPAALKDYQQLSQVYPNDGGFKIAIQELTAEIKSGATSSKQ